MIKMIVLDVDGCLSDGKITYSDNGEELKSFNAKDGLGIVSWLKLGKKVAIITGRNSSIVEKRAKDLGVNYFYQGVKDKKKTLKEILNKENIYWNEVAVIGDDLNDLAMIKKVKLSFAPKDASGVVKRNVTIKLEKKGGKGAVREMIEYVIKRENLGKEFLKLWL